MNINLADELKNLKVTLQLSVDSVTIGNAVSKPPARTSVTGIGVRLCTQTNGFLLKINANGYRIWAKSFAVSDLSQIVAKNNPFEDDNGDTIIPGYLAPSDTFVGAAPAGYIRVVRVWALQPNGSQFESPYQAQGEQCPSSSSSSNSSVSSASTSSRSSLNSGISSGSTVSMSSITSASSFPSLPSGTSGSSPIPFPAKR